MVNRSGTKRTNLVQIRKAKGGNQGSASTGKKKRNQGSLQNSNWSAKKANNEHAQGSASMTKQHAPIQTKGQTDGPIGQKLVTRYYPENVQYPRDRQGLFGLSLKQVLRPARPVQHGANKSHLLIHNKQLHQ
jgi:hypothetical protein